MSPSLSFECILCCYGSDINALSAGWLKFDGETFSCWFFWSSPNASWVGGLSRINCELICLYLVCLIFKSYSLKFKNKGSISNNYRHSIKDIITYLLINKRHLGFAFRLIRENLFGFFKNSSKFIVIRSIVEVYWLHDLEIFTEARRQVKPY